MSLLDLLEQHDLWKFVLTPSSSKSGWISFFITLTLNQKTSYTHKRERQHSGFNKFSQWKLVQNDKLSCHINFFLYEPSHIALHIWLYVFLCSQKKKADYFIIFIVPCCCLFMELLILRSIESFITHTRLHSCPFFRCFKYTFFFLLKIK